MILAVTATKLELKPFLQLVELERTVCLSLVTGVGPVETSVRLALFLARCDTKINLVINFGVAGAYVGQSIHPKLLDICMAEEEIFGDFGFCSGNGVEYFDSPEFGKNRFSLDRQWLKRAKQILDKNRISCWSGSFITVNCASATRHRGNMLQQNWAGLCENMEGAAVVRVCSEFDLPCLEIRAISNYVEDRDPVSWQLEAACEKAAHAAHMIIKTPESLRFDENGVPQPGVFPLSK